MTIYIDVDERTGCGNCEETCPEVFRFNAVTEKAEVIMSEGGPEDFIVEAIDNCSSSCICEE